MFAFFIIKSYPTISPARALQDAMKVAKETRKDVSVGEIATKDLVGFFLMSARAIFRGENLTAEVQRNCKIIM